MDAPLLSVHGLTRRFGGLTALDAMDLDVSAGTRVAVVGPNGAGKSTLLRLVAGHDRPSSGSVLLDGSSVTGWSPHRLARAGIALARQVPRPLATLTVAENVEIGLAAGRHRDGAPPSARLRDLLALTDLDHRRERRAGSLGLLDLKRLEVARALASEPRVLLLDEVSAGLTEAETDAAIRMLMTIHEEGAGLGRTLLFVEHVQEVVRRLAQRVVVLDWGRLLSEGTPEQVAADPEVQRVYLGESRAGDLGRLGADAGRRGDAAAPVPGLEVSDLLVRRGGVMAVRGVSLRCPPAGVVAVLGANGAGKTSLSSAISGLVPAEAGSVRWEGREIARAPAHRRARLGIAHCQEGRRLFPGMSVSDNLHLGAFGRPRADRAGRLEEVLEVFPVLRDRLRQTATTLSGGQQQMVAIGRALMSAPRLLVLDEATLGLSPKVADEIYAAFAAIVERGTGILLVEQDAGRCLAVASYAYVLARGRVVLEGQPDALDRDQVRAAYLGAGPSDREVSAATG